MEFGEFKQHLIEITKDIDACAEGFKLLQKAESWLDLCLIVRDSFEWCVENKLITPELIQEHWLDCKKANIYCNESVQNGFIIVTSGNDIDVWGHSFVIALGNAHVTAYDTTYVVAKDDAEVEAYDHCYIKACDNSKVTCHDYASATPVGNPDIIVDKGQVCHDFYYSEPIGQ